MPLSIVMALPQQISLSAYSFDSALFWYGNGSGIATRILDAVDSIFFSKVRAKYAGFAEGGGRHRIFNEKAAHRAALSGRVLITRTSYIIPSSTSKSKIACADSSTPCTTFPPPPSALAVAALKRSAAVFALTILSRFGRFLASVICHVTDS